MSFGSGKSKLPQDEPNPAGFDSKRLATNQQARALPYLAGVNRIGVTYLGDAFDQYADAIYQDAKKVQVLSGWNYYASFSALICAGPLDALYALYVGEELLWEGTLTRSGDYVDFTVENRGTVRLYWGTETQGLDATLVASLQGHPAYRGQAYLVFKDWFVGYNRTSIDNLEVVVARWPEAGWFTSAGQGNVQRDANMVAVLAEWWGNTRYGLGLPTSRLDTAALAEVAERMYSECVGVSPVVNTQSGARELLVRLLEYGDAFLIPESTGKLSMGLMRETPCGDIDLSFSETDMAEVLVLTPEDWDSTANLLSVTYTNRDNHFKEDAAPSESAANRQVTQAVLQETLERPWITRQRFAQAYANVAAARLGVPGSKGTMRLRKSRLQGLEPGGVFRLSYAPDGLCNLLCRATRVTIFEPEQPMVDVDFEVDRANMVSQWFTPPDHTPPQPPEVVTVAFEHVAIMEIPYTMDQGVLAERLGFFVARPNRQTNNAVIHRQIPAGSYQSELQGSAFAFRGTLNTAYGADTLTVDDQLGIVVDLTGADLDLSALASLTKADAVTDEWLLWVNDGPGAGFGYNQIGVPNTVNGELLSVWGAQLLAPGQYRLWAIRGRYDTPRMAHLSGAEVFILSRGGLATMSASINSLPLSPAQNFKFQPFAFGSGLDLSAVTAVSFQRASRGFKGAAARNLKGNGTFRPSISAAEDLVLTWDRGHNNRPDDLQPYVPSCPGQVKEFFLFVHRGHVIDPSDPALMLVLTVSVDVGVFTHTLTSATLLTYLGSLEDFCVDLVAVTKDVAGGGYFSVQHEQLNATLL